MMHTKENLKQKLEARVGDVADERISQMNDKALAAAGVAAILYFIAAGIAMAVSRKDILESIPYILGLCIMGAVIVHTQEKNKLYLMPLSFRGKPLDSAPTTQGKQKRLRFYLLDALGFSCTLCVLSCGAMLLDDEKITTAAVPSLAAEFIGMFVIDFTFSFFLYERKVKKYNTYLQSLEVSDEESEDL